MRRGLLLMVLLGVFAAPAQAIAPVPVSMQAFDASLNYSLSVGGDIEDMDMDVHPCRPVRRGLWRCRGDVSAEINDFENPRYWVRCHIGIFASRKNWWISRRATATSCPRAWYQ